MDIFSKPIGDITWSDIENHCDQAPKEGTHLDYKREFPRDLSKTIAAMANTLGGLILVGVDENPDATPKTPISGIPFERGLEERVISIAVSNVTPALIPEVGVCRDASGERAIVLIRVQQSHMAPHAQNETARVYIRTGNQNRPETEASLDRVFWLRDRRRSSVEFRQRLKEGCEERLDAMLRGLDPNFEPAFESGPSVIVGNRQDHMPALLTLFVSPLFPDGRMVDPPNIRGLRDTIEIEDWFGSDSTFPLPSVLAGRMVDHGWLSQYLGYVGAGNNRLFHTQLTAFGQFFYCQDLLFRRENLAYVRMNELISRIDQFSRSSVKLYEALGYFGSLSMEINLTNLEGVAINMRAEQPFDLNYSLDRSVSLRSEMTFSALRECRENWVFDSVRQIGWAFDQDLPPHRVDKLLQQSFGRKIADDK